MSKGVVKIPVKQRTSSFSDPVKYRIVSDEQVNFTKTKAFEFLELKTFSGERPVRERHVQFLFDEWNAGRFLWHHVLLACVEMGGEVYRINGQHTCWMRVNIPDKAEPVKAEVRVIRYKVETQDQIRALYSTFDRNATRSSGHVGKVMLQDTDAGAELTPSAIEKMVAGFKIYFCEDWNEANSNINELVGMITKNYAQLFNVTGRFYQMHRDDARWVSRASVIGAMLSTFEKAVQPSGEFWSSVFEGIGINEKSDPRWQLRHYLENHGHSSQGGKDVVSQEEAYRTCINMWNKWRRKEQVTMVRPMEKRCKAL